jgi:ribosome-associated translation inhibitor RaiA
MPEVRDYVDKKVRGLGDYLDLVESADVEFDRDVKRRPEPLHVVKITLHLLAHRTPDLRVREIGRDQRGTFDMAIARMESEAMRVKERIKGHPLSRR